MTNMLDFNAAFSNNRFDLTCNLPCSYSYLNPSRINYGYICDISLPYGRNIGFSNICARLNKVTMMSKVGWKIRPNILTKL